MIIKRLISTSSRCQSHIGSNPINIPTNIKVDHSLQPLIGSNIPLGHKDNTLLTVTGPLGDQSVPIKPYVILKHLDNEIKVSVQNSKDKDQRSMWGSTRSLIQNAITGVTEGFRVNIRLVGVGYRANLENDGSLNLKLGFSHPVVMKIPQGVTAETPAPNRISLSGNDKQQLTSFAAAIRHWRKPEPYNGKGIFINDETITRKDKR